VLETGSFARVSEIAAETCERFVTSGHDGVFLLYNEFRGNLALKQLLPIVPTVTTHDVVDYLYEPSRDVLLESLLPTHVATQLFRAALESTAAEHFARMMAMESATQNAKDVVNRLTLVYNRARQAAITKELMEIIGGAEALK